MRPKTGDVLRAPRTNVSLKFGIQRQCGAAFWRLWADTFCLAALALKVLDAHHVVAGARVCFTNSAMRLRRSALTWLTTFSSALRTKSRLISRGISLCAEKGVAHADTQVSAPAILASRDLGPADARSQTPKAIRSVDPGQIQAHEPGGRGEHSARRHHRPPGRIDCAKLNSRAQRIPAPW